jgi:hypothetical protein
MDGDDLEYMLNGLNYNLIFNAMGYLVNILIVEVLAYFLKLIQVNF